MATIKAETWSRRRTAAEMRVGVETIDRMVAGGQLPGAFRVGKRWHIPVSNISRFLNKRVPSVDGSGALGSDAHLARSSEPSTDDIGN